MRCFGNGVFQHSFLALFAPVDSRSTWAVPNLPVSLTFSITHLLLWIQLRQVLLNIPIQSLQSLPMQVLFHALMLPQFKPSWLPELLSSSRGPQLPHLVYLCVFLEPIKSWFLSPAIAEIPSSCAALIRVSTRLVNWWPCTKRDTFYEKYNNSCTPFQFLKKIRLAIYSWNCAILWSL